MLLSCHWSTAVQSAASVSFISSSASVYSVYLSSLNTTITILSVEARSINTVPGSYHRKRRMKAVPGERTTKEKYSGIQPVKIKVASKHKVLEVEIL